MVSNKRKFISWIGCVLLAFNLVGGFALPLPSMDPANSDGVICTSSGMVSLADLSDRTTGDARHAPTVLCKFCMPLMHAGLDAADGGTVLGVPTVIVGEADQSRVDQRDPHADFAGLIPSPRAPPVSLLI